MARQTAQFTVREIDENTYSACRRLGDKEWIRTYGGERPSVEQVKGDWRDEPKTFRKVGS